MPGCSQEFLGWKFCLLDGFHHVLGLPLGRSCFSCNSGAAFFPTPHCAGGPVFPKIPGFQAGWIFQSVVDAATAALEEENKFLPPLCSSAEGSQL